ENGGDTGTLLQEFRGAWGTNWPAEANLAHFLSGAPLGGGLAYVNVLCDHSFGFGVSADLSATVNWSNWTGAPGDFWDFLVFAHELGHNFGSLHTHDYCPPLDRCADNCTGTTACTRATIMRQRANASCLEGTELAPGDFVQYRVRFNPLFSTGAKSATLSFPHDAPNALKPFR